MAHSKDDGPARPPVNRATPRWVKLFAGTGLALLAVFVAVHLLGGGLHHHSLGRP